MNPTPPFSIKKIAEASFPTRFGHFRIIAFGEGTKTHIALVKTGVGAGAQDTKHKRQGPSAGTPQRDGSILVRIHSKCLTGDALCSLRCDCRGQLEHALESIERNGNGVLVYLEQEGRGIGLANKIRAYALQDGGLDTVEANRKLGFSGDGRDYKTAATILKTLGVQRIRLLTNNPEKMSGMEKHGIIVERRVPLLAGRTEYNGGYLKAKKEKLGHLL